MAPNGTEDITEAEQPPSTDTVHYALSQDINIHSSRLAKTLLEAQLGAHKAGNAILRSAIVGLQTKRLDGEEEAMKEAQEVWKKLY